jgi:hypothetical protein
MINISLTTPGVDYKSIKKDTPCTLEFRIKLRDEHFRTESVKHYILFTARHVKEFSTGQFKSSTDESLQITDILIKTSFVTDRPIQRLKIGGHYVSDTVKLTVIQSKLDERLVELSFSVYDTETETLLESFSIKKFDEDNIAYFEIEAEELMYSLSGYDDSVSCEPKSTTMAV